MEQVWRNLRRENEKGSACKRIPLLLPELEAAIRAYDDILRQIREVPATFGACLPLGCHRDGVKEALEVSALSSMPEAFCSIFTVRWVRDRMRDSSVALCHEFEGRGEEMRSKRLLFHASSERKVIAALKLPSASLLGTSGSQKGSGRLETTTSLE